MAAAFRKDSIARRYALALGATALALLLASGLSEMAFGYREARTQIAHLQQVQALAAAREIEQYLRLIEDGVRDANKLPWREERFGTLERRTELHRLLVLFPALTELRDVDPAGAELLFVSRGERDRIASGRAHDGPALVPPLAGRGVAFGPVYFADGADPLMRFSVPAGKEAAFATIATVNLRFLVDVLSGLRVGTEGRIFVVDSADRLIAHPRASDVLRQPAMADFEPVRRARAAAASATSVASVASGAEALNASAPVTVGAATNTALLGAIDTADFDGRPVITTAMRLDRLDWLLFVEQPRSEALAPALATLTRTLLLVALGAAAAVAASVLFARRMAAPIESLRQATGRIAAGDLEGTIEIDDPAEELQGLARDFRSMATRLAESYRGLESQVQARTAELSDARDRLQQQAAELERLNQRLHEQLGEVTLRREDAERANAAKTRFLAAASHDLRQPMHSIGLLVGVLGERLREAEPRALAGKVQQAVQVMEDLFASLLDISKLDSGVAQPLPETVDVGALLRRIEQTFAPQAAHRGLELRVRPARARVRTDPAWAERIVANLVSNALRYTARGGVLVGCRRRGAELAVQVWDTGCGIPPDRHDEIFDEFVRLDTPGHGQAQGLGLGLSIVKRSAERLGHTVSLRSVPGRGSMFELRMPLVQEAPAVAALEDTGTPPLRLDGLFVLVVDDDEDGRRALQAACGQWGALVETAASAADAIGVLELHLRTPDLLLTDHRLAGGSDGLTLVQQLRNRLDEPELPAVLLTADTSPEITLRAAQLGVPLLHKPAGAARVLQAIGAALARTPH